MQPLLRPHRRRWRVGAHGADHDGRPTRGHGSGRLIPGTPRSAPTIWSWSTASSRFARGNRPWCDWPRSTRGFVASPGCLTGIHDGKSGFTSVLGDVVITLLLDDDGRLSGNSGCNRYTASYTFTTSGLGDRRPRRHSHDVPGAGDGAGGAVSGLAARGGITSGVDRALRQVPRPGERRRDAAAPVRRAG